MHLLFLTNFYPPATRGGYELWCQEVADTLHGRGHTVTVLTSRHRREQLPEPDPAWVRRDLHLEMEFASLRNGLQFFTHRRSREQQNLAGLRQLVAQHRPDAVLVWGMWNLPRSLPALTEKLLPGRVAYYLGDYWPTLPSQYHFYWQAPPRHWATALPKWILERVARRALARETVPPLQLKHVLLPSAFMAGELARLGINLPHAKIVPGAIKTGRYPFRNGRRKTTEDGAVFLLWVGRLVADKGAHTALEALAVLVNQYGLTNLRLTMVGSGEPDYEARLSQLVQEHQLEHYVTFLGAQPVETLPTLYRQADIFLFTSIWPEPFGRVVVEAMASGAAVVGAATGGAAEMMQPGHNALTFAPADAGALAAHVVRLLQTPSLRTALAAAGRQTAVELYDIGRMAADIETCLQEVVNGS